MIGRMVVGPRGPTVTAARLMRAYTVPALILRTYRYGEADRIVVFLTEDRGKRRGVAKNASKSRRRFGAGLEPLTRGRVAYVEKEGRELVRLERIEPSGSPLGAVRGPGASDPSHVLATASYFAELHRRVGTRRIAQRAVVQAGHLGRRCARRGRVGRRVVAVLRVLAAPARGRVPELGRVRAMPASVPLRRGIAGSGRAWFRMWGLWTGPDSLVGRRARVSAGGAEPVALGRGGRSRGGRAARRTRTRAPHVDDAAPRA